jgi:glycosyltransferase involved in cell wall biosynthesis
MYSVIICSIDPKKFAAVEANISERFASVEHEIIRIEDATSIASGYNRGIERSRGDRLIFCHDDIEILNADFRERLDEHLTNFDLVGVMGTDKLLAGLWHAAGPLHIFGQLCHPDNYQPERFAVSFFAAARRVYTGMKALDGLFIAARRSVTDRMRFDAETFDNWHLYDLDFSFGAHLAGFKLAVATDLHLFHASKGMTNEAWRRDFEKFGRKYAGKFDGGPSYSFQFASITVPTRADAVAYMREASELAERRAREWR